MICLKSCFFVYRGALWSPQSYKIWFCWSDAHTDRTLRLCNAKTHVFKNIQFELLYSFGAKFLTPAKHKCPEIYVFNRDFCVSKQSVINRVTLKTSRYIPQHVSTKHVTKRYREDAFCQYGDLINKIKFIHFAGNRDRDDRQKTWFWAYHSPLQYGALNLIAIYLDI